MRKVGPQQVCPSLQRRWHGLCAHACAHPFLGSGSLSAGFAVAQPYMACVGGVIWGGLSHGPPHACASGGGGRPAPILTLLGQCASRGTSRLCIRRSWVTCTCWAASRACRRMRRPRRCWPRTRCPAAWPPTCSTRCACPRPPRPVRCGPHPVSLSVPGIWPGACPPPGWPRGCNASSARPRQTSRLPRAPQRACPCPVSSACSTRALSTASPVSSLGTCLAGGSSMDQPPPCLLADRRACGLHQACGHPARMLPTTLTAPPCSAAAEPGATGGSLGAHVQPYTSQGSISTVRPAPLEGCANGAHFRRTLLIKGQVC